MYNYLRALFLFLAPLLLSACYEGQLFGPDVPSFPSISTEGAQTIGCKVNGLVFTEGSAYLIDPPTLWPSYVPHLDRYSVNAYRRTKGGRHQGLSLRFDGPLTEGRHELTSVAWSDTDFCNRYLGRDDLEYIVETEPMELDILYVDTLERMVAGTFRFTVAYPSCLDTFRITDGRFDLKFIY